MPPAPGPKPLPLPFPNIPDAVRPEHLAWWWWLIIPGLALATILWIIWLTAKKPGAPVARPAPPWRLAMQRLEELREQVRTLPPEEVSHQVSVILRDYHLGRYTIPAPWRTTEELFAPPSGTWHSILPPRFREVAQTYDRLSFSSNSATFEDANALIESAMQALIAETTATPPPLPARTDRPVPTPPPLPTRNLPSSAP